MKKVTLTPLFMLITLTFAVAQVSMDLGIKGGMSIPNLTSGNTTNPINSGYGSRTGPDVAIFLEYHITPHFSIQPQVEYSSQGGQKNGQQAFVVPAELQALFPEGQAPPYLYANYNSKAIINYLMFPVLAKYRVSLGDHWRFYIAGGPFVSHVLSAKNKTSGSSQIYLDEQQTQPLPIGEQSFDRTENIKAELRKSNAGVMANLGFEYKLGRRSMFIEGGGNYGFIPIQKDAANGENNTGSIQILIGYAFPLFANSK